MKRSRIPFLIALVLALVIPGVFYHMRNTDPVSGESPDSSRIFLIPRDNLPEGSATSVERLEQQAERKLTPEEKQVFETKADGKWKVFEDEFLSFEIPADPLLEIEVVDGKVPGKIEIVGGAVGTTDNRFERAYRITVGPDRLPYGAILLSSSDWLDEGICFCGQVVLKRLLVREGTLREFSLLHSGDVKKVQVLSVDGTRAVLFEWTHSAISQETYLRIGDSLRLKSGAQKSRAEWIAESKDHRKGPELVGWVNPGETPHEIQEILGAPREKKEESLNYVFSERFEDGAGWTMEVDFPLKKGRFSGFKKDWVKYGELEPPKGSLAWSQEIADKEQIDADDARIIFEAFIDTFQGSDTPAWNSWCHAVNDLEEKGHRDERVLAPIRDRFLNPELDQNGAGCILDSYEAEGRDELFAARLKLCLDQTDDTFPELDDTWNLFSYLSKDHPEYRGFVRQAVNHPLPRIQAHGIRWAYVLPVEEARRFAKSKSKSEDRHVRSMTESLYRKIGDKSDLPDLQAWRDKEPDERLRDDLDELLEKLQ